MTEPTLARATGGVACICAAALGDALGRPVHGLDGAAALHRVGSSESAVTYATPPVMEAEPVREALPGTPSAATLRALALLESALLGPTDANDLIDDALRRVGLLGFPRTPRLPQGVLLGPSGPLLEAVQGFAEGRHPLSCASVEPDATLLVAGAVLGGAGIPIPRTAALLRSTSRDPVSLSAALALAAVTRLAAHEGLPAGGLVEAARRASQDGVEVWRSLPGTLGAAPEVGQGALTLSLARAGSTESAQDALAQLSRDASDAPDIILAAVLAAVATEADTASRTAVTLLRYGGAAPSALAALLGVTAALEGMKVLPLSWLAGLREHPRLYAFAEAATGGPRRTPRLVFPVADLGWRWAQAEMHFRTTREESRRSLPPPARQEQLALFQGGPPAPPSRRKGG